VHREPACAAGHYPGVAVFGGIRDEGESINRLSVTVYSLAPPAVLPVAWRTSSRGSAFCNGAIILSQVAATIICAHTVWAPVRSVPLTRNVMGNFKMRRSR
jgi:hypothetical protein